MKFSCEKCQAQYHIEDSKVGERGVRVRCKRCGNIIIVRRDRQPEHDTVVLSMPTPPEAAEAQADQAEAAQPPAEPPAGEKAEGAAAGRSTTRVFNFEEMQLVLREQRAAQVRGEAPAEPVEEEDWEESTEMAASAPPAASSSQQPEGAAADELQEKIWYVAISNEQVGPLSIAEVEERWKRGEISDEVLAWKPGMADWKEINGIPELLYLVRVPTKELRRRIGLISMADLGMKQERARARPVASVEPQPHPAPEPALPARQPAAAYSLSSDIGARVDTGTVDWKPSAAATLATLARDELSSEEPIAARRAEPGSAEMVFPSPSERAPQAYPSATTEQGARVPAGGIEQPAQRVYEVPTAAEKRGWRMRKGEFETKPETPRIAMPERRRMMLVVAGAMVVTFTGSAIYMKVIKPRPEPLATEEAVAGQEEEAQKAVQETGEQPAQQASQAGEKTTGESVKEEPAQGPAQAGEAKPAEAAQEKPEEKREEAVAAQESKPPEKRPVKTVPAQKMKKKEKPPRAEKRPKTPARPKPKKVAAAPKPKKAAPAAKPRDFGEEPAPKMVVAKAKAAPPSAPAAKPPSKAEDDLFDLEDEKPPPLPQPAKPAKPETVVVQKGLPPRSEPAKVEKPTEKPAKPTPRDDLLAFDKEFGGESQGDDFDDLLDSVGTKPKSAPAAKEAKAPKPEPPSAPPPPPPKPKAEELPKTLPPSEVKNVVLGNLSAIKSCVDAYRAKGGIAQGSLKMYWEILPNGKTSSVRVTSPEYKNTFLDACTTGAVKTWTFPKFSGSPIPINFPFKL